MSIGLVCLLAVAIAPVAVQAILTPYINSEEFKTIVGEQLRASRASPTCVAWMQDRFIANDFGVAETPYDINIIKGDLFDGNAVFSDEQYGNLKYYWRGNRTEPTLFWRHGGVFCCALYCTQAHYSPADKFKEMNIDVNTFAATVGAYAAVPAELDGAAANTSILQCDCTMESAGVIKNNFRVLSDCVVDYETWCVQDVVMDLDPTVPLPPVILNCSLSALSNETTIATGVEVLGSHDEVQVNGTELVMTVGATGAICSKPAVCANGTWVTADESDTLTPVADLADGHTFGCTLPALPGLTSAEANA